MKTGGDWSVHRNLGQLFEGRSISGLGEVQLLERFVSRRDEPAFAALVARHGPMVLGVCRRLLADPLDVEDAFQATFLVLVRRAGTLRDRDRLAPWLFGVARKVATRSRMNLARRRARECPGVEDLASLSDLDDPRRELGRALIEEIDRLPGRLREPILLCCVEGLTYDEAATRLRSTVPAVRGRLSRARERLRARLTTRGFAPTASALGALMFSETASAAVPASLSQSTIRASMAGAIPAVVEALAEGVIRTMMLTKAKFLAAAVVACGIAGTGLGVFAQQFPGRSAQDSDRLDKVEQKLDRLLRALEGGEAKPQPAQPGAPVPGPVPPLPTVAPPAPPTPPAVPETPAAVSIPAPGAPTALPAPPGLPAVATVPPGLPPAAVVTRDRVIRGAIGRGSSSGGTAVIVPDRLGAIEQKLAHLEARLTELERRLAPERRSIRNTAPARGADSKPEDEELDEAVEEAPDLPRIQRDRQSSQGSAPGRHTVSRPAREDDEAAEDPEVQEENARKTRPRTALPDPRPRPNPNPNPNPVAAPVPETPRQ